MGWGKDFLNRLIENVRGEFNLTALAYNIRPALGQGKLNICIFRVQLLADRTKMADAFRSDYLEASRMENFIWSDKLFKAEHLEEILKPKTAFVEFSGVFSRNFVLLGFLAFGVLATASGILLPRYPSLSVLQNTCILLSLYVIYLSAMRRWMGAWLHFGLSRNFPLSVVYCSFWFIGIFLSDVLGYVLGWDDHFRFDRLFWNCVITFPTSYAVVYAVAEQAKAMLGHDPDLVPIWWPTKVHVDPDVLVLKNANIIRRDGRVVVVETDDGEHEIRLSLSDVIGLVDPEKGARVHRSYWVAYKFMDRITYVEGNPKLICFGEQAIPISREAAKHLRDI